MLLSPGLWGGPRRQKAPFPNKTPKHKMPAFDPWALLPLSAICSSASGLDQRCFAPLTPKKGFYWRDFLLPWRTSPPSQRKERTASIEIWGDGAYSATNPWKIGPLSNSGEMGLVRQQKSSKMATSWPRSLPKKNLETPKPGLLDFLDSGLWGGRWNQKRPFLLRPLPERGRNFVNLKQTRCRY